MAYDEGLAERIRSVLEDEPGITEKKMFGGLAFLLDGKMFVGIATNDLMVRVGPERHQESLTRPHVRPMDFTGKPMVGYVFVGPEGIAEDRELHFWIRLSAHFVKTLPEKRAATTKRAPRKKATKPPSSSSLPRGRRAK